MTLCLLVSEGRHTSRGERVAALAEPLDAVVAVTGDAEWEGAVHIDELDRSFDAALAFGWRACLHVFRVEAERYGHVVGGLEERRLWHGDESRLLAALTYDLPLTLVAPTDAVARALRDHAPGRQVVVVRPGVRRDALDASAASQSQGDALRVATNGPAEEVLARASEPVEQVALGGAEVLLALADTSETLTYVAWAQLAGVVPVVTPIDGHDELVSEGETGLVVDFDDVPGTARALDALARDRELLARLSSAAREAASAHPTPGDEAEALKAAMAQAPPATDRPARLLLNALAVMEPIAQERRALDRVLREYEERIESLTGENDALRAELAAARRGLLERIRRR